MSLEVTKKKLSEHRARRHSCTYAELSESGVPGVPEMHPQILFDQINISQLRETDYSDVSIKNIDILPNRQYIANTADSAQEQYS